MPAKKRRRRKVKLDTTKIARYMHIGRNDMNWYAECQELFTELFGADKLVLVAKLFAATSINTSLRSNITLFRRALYEIQEGKPVGAYLPNMQVQIGKVRDGLELSGRKIRAFAAAMSGDPNAVVVDVWLLRAFGCDRKYNRKGRGHMTSGGATDAQFTAIEHYVRTEAKAMGIEPRQMSSMIWAGVRIDTNGDKETHYKQRLKYHLDNLFKVI